VIRLLTGPSGLRIPVVTGDFSFLQESRPSLGSTRSPIQCLPGFCPRHKTAGASSQPLTSVQCRGWEQVEQFLYPPPPPKSFHGVDSVLFTLSCFAVLGGWVGGKIVSLTLLLFYRYKYHSLHRWLGVTARMGRRKDWLRWLRLQPEERCGLRVLVYCPWHNKLLNGLPWHSAKHFSSFSYVISLNAWQLTRWKKWNWCLINNHSRLLPWLSQYTTTVNSSQDCS